MDRLIVSILICVSAAISNAAAGNNLPVGTVAIPEDVTVVVINDNNEHITIESVGKARQLRAGWYRIDRWASERKDADGNIWRLKGAGIGRRGVFKVVNDMKVKLSVGEPVISSLGASKSNTTYYLSHSLRGQLSETILITKNGNRAEAPKLLIRKADYSYHEILSFEYG